MSKNDAEHEMKLESMEVVEKDIQLKNRSLVGKNREVLEKVTREYVCSCGERFEIGRDARDHLLSARTGTDQRRES